ncbi:hypothetical protein AC482_04905 [miscellaneous Crenarchaeota group-15 archaeon DG-45]|uniref:Uncharacterized protein n=1 Tax=miscellaneous Crenarchaeota group-15 archaeon DG-45 TaxID=1685127 RepID=A0A0M0BNZ3_9ARCH|nr:MAG: hypothetical protein AC482_04905 [miscellaneous Crenarchaeota group-15 archaeon DG-45]
MRKRLRLSLILLSILVMSMIISQNITCLGQPDRSRPRPFDWDIDPEEVERLRVLIPRLLTVKAIINTLSSMLILGIVIIHINILRRTGTKFSLGLVIFSTALLLYTLAANPLIHRLVGFSRIGFGPMLLIPDVFALIASAVLLYLSRK